MLKLSLAAALMGMASADNVVLPAVVLPARRILGSHNGSNTTTAAPTTTTAAPTTTTTAPKTTAKAAASNATTAAATTAAKAAATTTKAATAAATTAAGTKAATTAAAKVTKAATTTAAATTASNVTNGTTLAPPVKTTVKTSATMKVKLDISTMSSGVKKAVGNSFAFGLHAGLCETIKSQWLQGKMANCFLNQFKESSFTTKVAIAIDNKLMATTPSCVDANNCYGAKAPSRLLAAVDIVNKADFEVEGTGTAAAAAVTSVSTTIKAAATGAATGSGALSAGEILKKVQTAMKRTYANAPDLANFTAAVETAVKAATMSMTTPVLKTVNAPTAPAKTSGAVSYSMAGVLAVAAALLM